MHTFLVALKKVAREEGREGRKEKECMNYVYK